ncbi:uncharacterized protein LOC113277787 [Papaver somniferum]|uniref:uncharacterized protein LOC113277787 n=1 Tax=Papaver somniferum TaxID=3469 RepID=UPI000E6F92C6|nr:uncharacterized protein LOC113277787 [Papaver somniferum]
MTSYLGDYQFGVGVPVGVESILHAVNCLLELKGHSNKMSMLLIDFSNAFNMQGDPLGPLLFALNLHPLVKTIVSRCTLDLHAWYLDDGTIIGDTMEVAKTLSIIEAEGPSRGLHLNVRKIEVFWPSIDPRSTLDGVFPLTLVGPLMALSSWADL